MALDHQQVQQLVEALQSGRGQAVVAAVPMSTTGTLTERKRKGQRVHVYASLIYGNGGVAYLAIGDTGDTLLISSNAIAVSWPDRLIAVG